MCKMSQTIGALAAALAKAQGEMSAAEKSSDNPYFKSKYADLSSCWDAARGPLSKNGLAVIQTTEIKEGDTAGVVINTTLAHSSGEWISGSLFMPLAKRDPQAVGSAITYGRRYGLSAIVGIVADDDDGEAAAGRGTQAAPRGTQTAQKAAQRPAQGQQNTADAKAQSLKALKNLLLREEGVGLRADEVAPWIRQTIGRSDVSGFDALTANEIKQCMAAAKQLIAARNAG